MPLCLSEKCVIPGILHEKLGLTKKVLVCFPFPYYITGIP